MSRQSAGDVISLRKPDPVLGDKWVLERPRVYYNKKTGKCVMYMHIDGSVKGVPGGGYDYTRVGVAVSNKPTGPFRFIRTFRPLGKESRDIGQFIDDDGSAYLIFECRPTGGFYIAKLSENYLNVDSETCFIHQPLEGGAVVHYKGLYYAVDSGLTGWAPNANKVATATSLKGPWSDFADIAPSDSHTYNSQSTMFLRVAGKKDTTIIFMADQWRPSKLSDSRYLWMPVQIGGGILLVPEPKPWQIDVSSGKWLYVKSGIPGK